MNKSLQKAGEDKRVEVGNSKYAGDVDETNKVKNVSESVRGYDKVES